VKATAVTAAELVRGATDEAKDGQVDLEEEEEQTEDVEEEEEEEAFFQRTLNDGIAEGVGEGGLGGGGRRSSGGGVGGTTGDTSAEIISAAALEGSDLSAVAAARGSVEGEVPGGFEGEGRGRVEGEGGESVERVGLAPGAGRALTPGPEGYPRRPRPVPRKHLGVLDDPQVYEVLFEFFCLFFFYNYEVFHETFFIIIYIYIYMFLCPRSISEA
jgi:hypothetical protein